MNQITAATLLFEGSTSEVAAQKHSVFSIAKKFGGYYGEVVLFAYNSFANLVQAVVSLVDAVTTSHS